MVNLCFELNDLLAHLDQALIAALELLAVAGLHRCDRLAVLRPVIVVGPEQVEDDEDERATEAYTGEVGKLREDVHEAAPLQCLYDLARQGQGEGELPMVE